MPHSQNYNKLLGRLIVQGFEVRVTKTEHQLCLKDGTVTCLIDAEGLQYLKDNYVMQEFNYPGFEVWRIIF